MSVPDGIPETPEEELILQLRSERAVLLGVLTQALILSDQLMTEMRLANVTPSGPVVFSKAEFDRQMRILLGRQHK